MCQVKLDIKYTGKSFDKLSLKAKAEYVMALKKAEIELKDAIASVKTVFEQDFNDSRNDITETIRIETSFGMVELPAGYKEKTLKDGEVVAFSDALKKLDKTAFDEAVSFVPKIGKVAINDLRKNLGPVKDLIDETYKTTDSKPAVYTFNGEL